MTTLDPAQAYRALRARDPRFDGVFFVGVTSTRIYCRPICPAPCARADRCRFFVSAAAAERRGFRPCLRCRPELAPADVAREATQLIASVDAVTTLARHAAARIAAGALDVHSVETLATELGVSDRHLRRVLERELGASPAALAQTRRLLTAKQLLTDTALPVSQVAYAAGFSSLRRFNALFRTRYRLAPSALRRGARVHDSHATDGDVPDSVSLWLSYRPPYDWPQMLRYLEARATAGVELVTHARGGRYWRTVALRNAIGVLSIAPAPRGGRTNALRVTLSASLVPEIVPLLARVRRLLDLDCAPRAVAAHLGEDPLLGPLLAARPGLRVPGAFDGAELAIRTVIGQQVSVRGANTLARRFVERLATPLPDAVRAHAPEELTHVAVTPAQLRAAGGDAVAAIGMPRTRAAAIVSLAEAIGRGDFPELVDAAAPDPVATMRRLEALPGIGAWTAHYIAMRALSWPDAFPDGDLVLRKAAGSISAVQLRTRAEAWRPWRAYAAQHLWASQSASPEAER
ncbi:MAG: helix-turn-helix domain-containing protein [Gemmatimonadaceae bacterium]|nr:helix-turn-helix domain-containing protein [Gemmatimonadaceae bacterium]